MATDLVGELERSFVELGVTHERVAQQDLVAAIEDAAIEPAVATPLDAFDVSLESTALVVDPTPAEVWEAHTGVTGAAFAIADYGSLFLPHDDVGSEHVSLFVDHHIAVLQATDVVSDMPTAFTRLGDDIPVDRGSGIIATGPSATADMGALVKGAHGPETVHAIIVTEA